MSEKKETADVVEETTEVSEQSRRDFITKMVTAAGAVAAAGLVASTQNADASDETLKIDGVKGDIHKSVTEVKWGKLSNGFKLTLSGMQVGQALQGAGVLTRTANLQDAKITIEFSA